MHSKVVIWPAALAAGFALSIASTSAASQEVAPGALAQPVLLAVATPEPSVASHEVDPLFAEFPDGLDGEFDTEFDESEDVDPLEGVNRRTFGFNRFLDRWIFDPVTNVYQFAVPTPLRKGVHNFFLNLETPVVLTNQLLQLRGSEATLTFGRFLVNTTAGAGGLFDAAGRGLGWERSRADFGQTLAVWGSPSGAYLVVPILGPSTVRDFGGDIVDRLLDPLTYVIGPLRWWVPLGVGQGLSVREAHAGELNELEQSSVDFYSALRSAYLQSRAAEIRDATAPRKESAKLAVDTGRSAEPES